MRKPFNNYAFIDGQNLNLGIQDLGWKLDFQRFRVYLKEKYGVSTAFYFIGKVAENNELYEALQNAGYVLIYKEVLTDPFGKQKGNIDAELVLQAMAEYKNYDKAVIVSGDGDFACLVTYLDNKRKLERVIVPNLYRYSALLKKAAATRLDSMNELKRKLAYTFSRKKTDDTYKPAPKEQAFSKPRLQKQISVKPIKPAPNKPKTFSKKFRYPRNKAYSGKPQFSAGVSDGVRNSTESADRNSTESADRKTLRSPSDKKPAANPASDKQITSGRPKRRPFFKFRFNKHNPFKKRTP